MSATMATRTGAASRSVVIPAAAQVILDRLVSASSLADALLSLKAIAEGFQASAETPPTEGNSPTDELLFSWQTAWIWQHEEGQVAEVLVFWLQHGKLPSMKDSDTTDDEGVTLILQLYHQHLASDKQSLESPGPGRLLEALLDVMDSKEHHHQHNNNVYTRVLALKVLEVLSKKHSRIAHAQWLQAPNGVHRLAETLTAQWDNPVEEAVRTQALQVAQLLLATNASMAKVFLFAEVETQCLDLIWHAHGGLTKGQPGALDLLHLVHSLLQHADGALQELVWQRPSVAPRLAQLVDLRGGYEFLHPESIVERNTRAKVTTKPTKEASSNHTKKKKLGPLSQKFSNNDDDGTDDDDDLDNLLGTTSTKPSTKSKEKSSSAADLKSSDTVAIITAGPTSEAEKATDEWPRLMDSEEEIVMTALNIIDLLLESETVRPSVWKQHTGLLSLIWELALIRPPPAGSPPVCALPSAALQQRALELVARKINDPITMDRHNGLDRLLYLVCTGGGAGHGHQLPDRMGVSQAALAVLRHVLDDDRIHSILVHTLAPPPTPIEEDEPKDGEPQVDPGPPPPTVVEKLWNTVAENLHAPDSENRTLFLSGALGGLSVFLIDTESREMVYQATPATTTSTSMMETMLEVVSQFATSGKDGDLTYNTTMTTMIQWSLWRFLCDYIYQTPRLVETLLSSSASTHLASLASVNFSCQPLVYLLLGLLLDGFPSSGSNNMDCGGWTKDSLLEVLQTIGISKLTKTLEAFKTTKDTTTTPWLACDLEAKCWQIWYPKAVWTVRKCMVQALAGGNSSGDNLDPDANGKTSDTSSSPGDTAALQTLLAQQTTELDELRTQLEQAQNTVSTQESQLITWQRRMDSLGTPTELENMLTELTTQNASLQTEVATLKSNAERTHNQHEQEVTTSTEDLKVARHKATQSQETEKAANEERERMEQELQALSLAYSNLEEEYRRSGGPAPAAVLSQSEIQSQGEPSAPTTPGGGSTELSTLRAENDRLRQDARAADEWMALAVKRMNEMGMSQEQMQLQVSTLQAQLATVRQHDQSAQLYQQVEQLSGQERQLRSQIEALEEQVRRQEESRRVAIQELEAQRASEMELALASAREELDRSQEQSQNQCKDLQHELKEAQAAMLAASSSKPAAETLDNDPNQKELRQELGVKTAQIYSLEASLVDTLEGNQPAPESKLASDSLAVRPQTSGEGISHELETSRQQVEEIRSRSQQDIYQKEAIIRELEDRLNGGLGAYTLADIRQRDDEIEELRVANEAAQEWMSKAVEHHQLLREQVAALTEEKANLTLKVGKKQAADSQDQQLTLTNVNVRSAKFLEAELQEMTSRLEQLQAQMSQRESELSALKEELVTAQAAQEDMGIARDDAQVLQKKLEDSQVRVQEVESKLAANALYEETVTLRKSNEDLETRLEEFQSWAGLAQTKITELITAKETAEATIKTKDAEIDTLQSQTGPATSSYPSNLPTETESDHSVVDQLRSEMASMEAANFELSNERNGLATKYKELELKLQELQAWTDGAQQRIFEVVTAKEQLEAEAVDLKSQLAEAAVTVENVPPALDDENNNTTAQNKAEYFFGQETRSEPTGIDPTASFKALTEKLRMNELELSAALETLSGGEDVVRQWEERVEELEADIVNLQSQAQEQEEEANMALSQWQDSLTQSEHKCSDLEEELRNLKSQDGTSHERGLSYEVPQTDDVGQEDEIKKVKAELKAAQDTLEQDEDVVNQWEDRVAALEVTIQSLIKQIEEEQNQANDVISQWQESCGAADERCTELAKQLAETQAKISEGTPCQTGTNSADEPQAKLESYQHEIEELKNQLVTASSSGEVHTFASIGDGGGIVEDAVDAAILFGADSPDEDFETEVERMKAQLQAKEEELRTAQEALNQDQDVVQQWEDKVLELETEMISLQTQMANQEVDANAAISKWQESHSEAEERCDKLAQELDRGLQEKQAEENDEETRNATNASAMSHSEEKLRIANEGLLQAEEAVRQWEETSSELEMELRLAKEGLAQVEHEKIALETKLTSIESEATSATFVLLQAKEDELMVTSQGLVEAEDLVRQFEERSQGLESELVVIKTTTEEQRRITESSLKDRKEKSSSLELRCVVLENDKASLEATIKASALPSSDEQTIQFQQKTEEVAELQATIAKDEEIVQQWEQKVDELESTVTDLQAQLQTQEIEANDAIEAWQQNCSQLETKEVELEERIANVEIELTRNVEKLANHDWTIEQLQSEAGAYRNQLDFMKELPAGKERLEVELGMERGRYKEARDEIAALTQSLEETKVSLEAIRSDSEEVVDQWRERVEELETQLFQVQAQLALQETEANQAIASWESKVEDLESDLETTTEELRAAQLAAERHNEHVEGLETQMAEFSESLEQQSKTIEKLEAERQRSSNILSSLEKQLESLQEQCDTMTTTEENLKQSLIDAETEVKTVVGERDHLKEIQASKSREVLGEERDRLTIVIAQLEAELIEANNMVQTYVTDETSDRATEAAARALRAEIEELKYHIDDYRRSTEEERYAKETAELEIERLRDDIAALVSLNEQESPSNEIQQRTAKAVERLKMKERIEIAQLRKSLYRAIEEVEIARAAEKESNEKLSRIRLQTSIGEQEIIATKSEMIFLTQALEELRLNEESKRASLEYRIGSLEDENDVLRKYHSSELETVRNEFAQVGMEKDRILNQLRESEKTNSALVLAASKAEDHDIGDGTDLDMEVSKLRIENAHLLTVAADDKARAERRLREVLAAHRAMAEADTILEHELRLAAESTIQNLKMQLEELRNARVVVEGNNAPRDITKTGIATTSMAAKLTKELGGLQTELHMLKKENSALKSKLGKEAANAKSCIAALTEECRQAQAKTHKLERDGRYDTAIQKEVAKLRMSPDKRDARHHGQDWMLINNNNNTPGGSYPFASSNNGEDPATQRVDPSPLSAEAFDLICKQKEDIQEERRMYLEFLEEHDDLLALLAQHDLERSCLKDALGKALGTDALAKLLHKVEEMALEQFGNVIKVA